MADLHANALKNRTILVTRAAAQSESLTAELQSYGARVIAFPLIEIVPPESFAELDHALADLFGYDWIVFTSVNGVDYFLTRLEFAGKAVSELDQLRVCAIGEATATRLAEANIHVDVVPTFAHAEGAFAAIVAYVGSERALDRLNFLLPRALAARDYLPSALTAAGARVDIVTAYKTIAPQAGAAGKLSALIAGGGVDCVTFTSSSTVQNFAALMDCEDLSAALDGVVVACIGDVTAASAAAFGLTCVIRPAQTTAASLAQAIAAHFAKDP